MVALLAQFFHLLRCPNRQGQTSSQVQRSRDENTNQSSEPFVERSIESKSPAFSTESTVEELKIKGNELFGQGDVVGAVACWSNAREKIANEAASDMLRSLDANLALGHLRLRDWMSALTCADAALAERTAGSIDVKVLHRRALALAGLKRWSDAEEALREFEEAGGASSLAVQTRRDWDRAKRKVAAVVSKTLRGGGERIANTSSLEWAEDDFWSAPKLDWMPVFPLREHSAACSICWDESANDFNDEVWTPDGMSGRKPHHFATSLPLTTLAGAALAELKVPAEPTIHLLHGGLGGDLTHDWGSFLARCPDVQVLHVVYVGLFGAHDTSDAARQRHRGTLTREIEEARVEKRVVKVSRFTGSYSELLAVIDSNELRELRSPWLALSLDLPIAIDGPSDAEQLREVMDALSCMASLSTPVLVTLPANTRERQLRAPAQRAMATFRFLRARVLVDWQWNRFSVCKKTKQGENCQEQVFIGAYAVIGVLSFEDSALDLFRHQPSHLLNALDARRVPRDNGKDIGDLLEGGDRDRAEQVTDMVASDKFQKQFQAFKKKMEKEGRPTGQDMTREEQHRQGMEFAAWIQSCSRTEWEDECIASVEEVSDDMDPDSNAC